MVGLIYPDDRDEQQWMNTLVGHPETPMLEHMTDEDVIVWFRGWAAKEYPCEVCGQKIVPLELAKQVSPKADSSLLRQLTERFTVIVLYVSLQFV